jgi:hypothetical protein
MRKLFKVSLVSILLFICAFATALPEASAALIFDRGLPTTNLNNAAGSDRSNVQWAFTADPSTPNDRWLVGDDFTIGGSQSYLVDTIRIWSTSNTDLSLWFGPAGGTIAQLAIAPTITQVTYANTSSYQGSSGNYLPLYQLDFNLGMILNGATAYQFFLNGPMIDFPAGSPPWTSLINAYVHSSNGALSGSTQQGYDNLLLYLNALNGIAGEIGTWDSNGNGWDKSSDGNVQVYGDPVPIPAAAWLLGSGLVGLIGLNRRRRKAS